MNLLTISIADKGGGAENIANTLHKGLQQRQHNSYILVKEKRTDDSTVNTIRDHEIWEQLVTNFAETLTPYTQTVRGTFRIQQLIKRFAHPSIPRLLAYFQGREMMHFPATRHLLERAPITPDIIHAHNLHGYYFDLRELAPLSQLVPVALTLHDMWLLTGHCAHSFDCTRWQIGCGNCPYLDTYPAVRRDATAENFALKQQIYEQSRLYVTTPSQWLMNQAEQSMLQRGIVSQRVIPNGVDTNIFTPPTNQLAVRHELNLPDDALILMFAAASIRGNPFKDYQTLRSALECLDLSQIARPVVLLGLGQVGRERINNKLEVQFVPFEFDVSQVAKYYQAADIYVHPARADTFPNSVLEAAACGLPIIGTAVGGIPEQVKSLNHYQSSEATGILTPVGDADELAKAMKDLLTDEDLRVKLGANARRHVLAQFTQAAFIETYIHWYEEILEQHQRNT